MEDRRILITYEHHIHELTPSRPYMLDPHPATLGEAAFWIIHMLLLCILMVLIWSTLRRPVGKEIGLFVAYGATAIGGRILMEGAPNIQPVTILMLLAGAHLGVRKGISLALITTLFSNIALGAGLWSLYQASGWALVALSGALLSNWLIVNQRIMMWRLASLGLLSAFVFDWWVSLYIFHSGAGIGTYFQYLINGFTFDVLHAIGNLTFALWLTPLLNRFPEINSKARVSFDTTPIVDA